MVFRKGKESYPLSPPPSPFVITPRLRLRGDLSGFVEEKAGMIFRILMEIIFLIGKEFVNKDFKKYCDDNYMRLSHPYTSMHAGIIERFHRTLHRYSKFPFRNMKIFFFFSYFEKVA